MLTFLITSEIKVIKILQQERAETHGSARKEQACPLSHPENQMLKYSLLSAIC